jgi:hypothetical protein
MPIMLTLLAAIQFSKDDSTQWVVLCVGVLATLYLIMRGRAKKRKDPLERRPSMGVSQQRQIERDMGQLMVEMLDTARQMTAQLDTRAARLEILMKEADEKLASLKAATSGIVASPAEHPITAYPPVPVSEGRSIIAKPEKLEIPPDPRHADVYQMADQGSSPNEIARQLNRPHGEVELILALRSR